MKRLISIVLVLLLAFSLCATAYADTEISGGIEGTSTGTTAVGTITPIQIKGIVPTSVTFGIDPNKAVNYTNTPGDAFTAPTFTFQNACNAPLTFTVQSIAAQASMPPVVINDKFTDEQWEGLTKTETLSNIAFGFVCETPGQWLSQTNADAWYALSELPLGVIAGQSNANLHLKAKYGLAWDNAEAQTISYDIVYKITVA